jgi:hypothetical protein
MIIFPRQVNLVMARAAAEIRLFFGLVRVEVAATVGRHAMDPASVFLVHVTCRKTWRDAPQSLPLSERQIMLPVKG